MTKKTPKKTTESAAQKPAPATKRKPRASSYRQSITPWIKNIVRFVPQTSTAIASICLGAVLIAALGWHFLGWGMEKHVRDYQREITDSINEDYKKNKGLLCFAKDHLNNTKYRGIIEVVDAHLKNVEVETASFSNNVGKDHKNIESTKLHIVVRWWENAEKEGEPRTGKSIVILKALKPNLEDVKIFDVRSDPEPARQKVIETLKKKITEQLLKDPKHQVKKSVQSGHSLIPSSITITKTEVLDIANVELKDKDKGLGIEGENIKSFIAIIQTNWDGWLLQQGKCTTVKAKHTYPLLTETPKNIVAV